MELIAQKIQHGEKMLERDKSIAKTIAMALRYWLGYQIRKNSQEAANDLNRAFHACASMLKSNALDVRLQFCCIFMSVEVKGYDYAADLLEELARYRGFFKSKEPESYIVYLFLYSLMETRQDNTRAAKKYNKQLKDYPAVKHEALRSLFLGVLSLERQEDDDAYAYFADSFKRGCRSALLYTGLKAFYETEHREDRYLALLLPLMQWAVAQEADIGAIMTMYQEGVPLSFAEKPFFCTRLYAAYPNDWILNRICIHLMRSGDESEAAYGFYRDAVSRQMQLPGLNTFFIKSAYKNKKENVSHYSMKDFLQTGEMDQELQAFVYHLMLTRPALEDLVDEYINPMMQFCVYCLDHDKKGRYYNSLYKCFLDVCQEQSITGRYLDKAESLLEEDLFCFDVEVDHPEARYMYISETERRDMSLYPLHDGYARVRAVGDGFQCFCLSANKRSVLEVNVKVGRRIENANLPFYLYMFRKGNRSFEMLAVLANYYLAAETEDAMREEPEGTLDDRIAVLDEVLSSSQASTGFKMRARAALGHILYGMNKLNSALSYYKEVDENYLDDMYIEQMLTVFVNADELEGACRLVVKKSQCISDRALFIALKKLAQNPGYHRHIADTAYELLMKSWYDKTLLDIVVEQYNGGQEEWQELARTLASISVSEKNLDELILKNSIWMHKFDTGAQKVFVRLFSNTPDNPLIEEFAYYTVYEIIVNDVRPEHDTIDALEKLYVQSADKYLCYALCSVYLKYDLSTLYSEGILRDGMRYQEEELLLLPVFKDNRDKIKPSPYIEKIQPFLYRTLPDKNVWLHYKIDGEGEFCAKKMSYTRFGIYMTTLAHFYGESITYYFSEEMPTGSIVTKEFTVQNCAVYFTEEEEDPFFTINNALIYEQMFKYEQVEKIITTTLREAKRGMGRIL